MKLALAGALLGARVGVDDVVVFGIVADRMPTSTSQLIEDLPVRQTQ